MQWRTKTVYLFSAIFGQEKMKLSLILNVINPKIGGFLLRGEKGMGKSLVVRALAHLLPEVNVVTDCPCIVTLHAPRKCMMTAVSK
jgi:Mg-chelatase subunit ChlI